MACTSGCRTQDHGSYADCLRSKSARVAYCDSSSGKDMAAQKKWDSELSMYRDAKRQGIQPAGTKREQIERAVAISDGTGTAYRAGA